MYTHISLGRSAHFASTRAITSCSAPAGEVDSNFGFFRSDDATSIVQKWKVPIGSVLENTLEFQAYIRALIMLAGSTSGTSAGEVHLPPPPSTTYECSPAPSEPAIAEHQKCMDIVVPMHPHIPPTLLGVLVSSDVDAFVVSLADPRRQCDLLMCLWRTRTRDDGGDAESFRRRRKLRELRVWLWDRGYGCTPHLHGDDLQHWFLSREEW